MQSNFHDRSLSFIAIIINQNRIEKYVALYSVLDHLRTIKLTHDKNRMVDEIDFGSICIAK